MKEVWINIREILNDISSKIAKSFNKPATQKEIQDFETAIGQKLPTSFVEYLTTFDGQNHNGFEIFFVGVNSLLTIKEILEVWKMQVELFTDEPEIEIIENKVKPKIWDKKWIPFSDFMGQQRLAIDLNPGTKGIYGQIIQLWAGQDLEDDKVVVANSFEDFSKYILRDLKSKNFHITGENIIEFHNEWII